MTPPSTFQYDDVLPLLDGCGDPDAQGEVIARCPVPGHEDLNPSFSLRLDEDGRARMRCYAGCPGEEIEAALRALGLPEAGTRILHRSLGKSGPIKRTKVKPLGSSPAVYAPPALPDQDKPYDLHRRLMDRSDTNPHYDFLTQERGFSDATLEQFKIGSDEMRIQIPVRVGGQWRNVRRYKPHAVGKDKVTSVESHGSPILYASGLLAGNTLPVLFCEGELDMLLAWQKNEERDKPGYVALTGTGGAMGVPKDLARLADREVFVAYDCDDAGRKGAAKIAAALAEIGATAHILDLTRLDLPADSKEDISDYFLRHGGTVDKLFVEMERLREEADFGTAARDRKVAEMAEEISLRRDAKALDASRHWSPPPEGGSLAERLKEPLQPLPTQIAGLSYEGNNVLIVAVEKAGKTVLALNVARALLSGAPLFGKFDVTPVAKGRSVA